MLSGVWSTVSSSFFAFEPKTITTNTFQEYYTKTFFRVKLQQSIS